MRYVSRRSKIKLTIIFVAAVLSVSGYYGLSADFDKVKASAAGPSPSYTNAPGETNCTACHSDFAVNSGTGGVQISGVPASYQLDQSIAVTVTTSQSDAVIYGFQLSAIDDAGRQAGSFILPNQSPEQLLVVHGNVGGNTRTYVEHTIDGIIPTQFGSKAWTFTWKAPSTNVGRVRFFAAGNAANSDGNTTGDRIYTTSASISAPAATARTRFDFDGDSKADIGIFRPAPREWWISRSTAGQIVFQFGISSADKPVPADFTGDGKTDVAFWRPNTGEWFVLRSEDFTYFAAPFGQSGDAPAPADFDADGKADLAVFRPSSGTWFINLSAGGSRIVPFGQTGDVPEANDYDGDGRADIAIFRPSTGEWWLSRSSLGQIVYQFGSSTDKPVPADYTGDGKTDVAFFRPAQGFWYILRSENSTYYGAPFGQAGDVPVPADYDGDGRADLAVFRPSDTNWYLNRSTAGFQQVQFGLATDKPVEAAFIP